MTIIGGISLDIEEQEPADSGFLRLSRQNSLLRTFGSFPDFNDLLTPGVKQAIGFDFEESIYRDMSSQTPDDAKNVSFDVNNIKIECTSPTTTSQPGSMSSFIGVYSEATSHYNSSTATKSEELSLDTMESQVVSMKEDGSVEMSTYSPSSTSDVTPTNNDMAEQERRAREELRARFHKAAQLNIPKNPWDWTVEQVDKWFHCVVAPDYGIDVKSTPNFTLNMDGRQLCLVDSQSASTMQNQAAQVILAEIGLWKTAWTNDEAQRLQSQQSHYYPQQPLTYYQAEEQRVYADLSSQPIHTPPQYNVMTSSASSLATSAIPIPTPVSTHSAMSLTLNELQQYEYTQQHLPQVAPPSSLPAHLQQQISPTSSVASSPGWRSSASDGYNSSIEEDPRGYSPPVQTSLAFNPAAVNTPRGPLPHSRNSIKLWQFLRRLLDEPNVHPYIRWTNREQGIFKIEDSQKVAKLWGQRKNRPAMNYDKLSRSIRQYYKKGIIKKTDNSKRLVYQFCTPYLNV